MADAFYGEIRAFSFNYAPRDWAMCNGAAVPVQQFQALASVIGNAFGGDFVTTFNLPDLRGAVPAHWGATPDPGLTPRVYAQKVGSETVTLTPVQMPTHAHTVTAGTVPLAGQTPAATPTSVLGRVGNATAGILAYSKNDVPSTTMAPQMVGVSGSGMPHENRQPFLPLNFCICLQGLYPVRP